VCLVAGESLGDDVGDRLTDPRARSAGSRAVEARKDTRHVTAGSDAEGRWNGRLFASCVSPLGNVIDIDRLDHGARRMQCPNCNAVVRGGSKFCVKCGTTLPRCPSCGDGIAADDLFCAHCGVSLQAFVPQTAIRQTKIAAVVAAIPTATAQSERRQITVMFLRHGGVECALDSTRSRRAAGGGVCRSCCAAEIIRLVPLPDASKCNKVVMQNGLESFDQLVRTS
jgi:hypothetical protein